MLEDMFDILPVYLHAFDLHAWLRVGFDFRLLNPVSRGCRGPAGPTQRRGPRSVW